MLFLGEALCGRYILRHGGHRVSSHNLNLMYEVGHVKKIMLLEEREEMTKAHKLTNLSFSYSTCNGEPGG